MVVATEIGDLEGELFAGERCILLLDPQEARFPIRYG